MTRRSLRSPGAASSPGARSVGCWPRPSAARSRYARRVPASRAHLLLDDLELAQADRRGRQAALAPKKRGPKPDASARQIQQLERDNARLRRKLERAELIIDAQKKLCVALGLPTADERSEDE